MPLELLAGNAGVRVNRVYNAGNRAGNNRAAVIDAIAHGVAAADFDRNSVLLLQLHQLKAERNDISVDIGSCDVLKMTPRADPLFEAVPDNREIMLHGFSSGHPEF